MRLITFLNEAVVKNKKLANEEALELIRVNCKNNFEALKGGKQLYRGDINLSNSSTNSVFYLPSDRSERKSANTTNFYTLLFSKYLPSWNAYPKRNRGIICTSSVATANLYNNNDDIFYVLPFDNCKIGVCPAEDIWDSFKVLFQYKILDLKYFNNSLYSNGIRINNFEKKLNSPLIEDSPIWALYYYMKQQMPKNQSVKAIPLPVGLALDGKTTLKDILNDMLSPKNNNFILISSLAEIPAGKHECWIDGDAILIRYSEDLKKWKI